MNREVCGICWCPYDDNGACGCKSLDEATRLPRAMAQAYENGYKAGVAAEREECAQVCEARFVGDLNREDMEARRCAAAIRARGNT